VEHFDEALRALVDDLFETMDAEEGAGLAAPQVGVSLRVFVVDARPGRGGKASRFALVNPRIVEVSDEIEAAPEGCLSIPGVSEVVRRPAGSRWRGSMWRGTRSACAARSSWVAPSSTSWTTWTGSSSSTTSPRSSGGCS
jgi:peptide deformylase